LLATSEQWPRLIVNRFVHVSVTPLTSASASSHTQRVTFASGTRGAPGVATPGAFLFWGFIVNRTVFLVDGFNSYHSALPHHLEARRLGVVRRQMRYLEALRATGVETRLGQFKRRERTCPPCGRRFVTFEEKETDVAIGTTLTRLVCDDACDTVVLVTGDTDLVPAVTTGRDRDPGKTLAVLFPYGRANAELKRVVDASFTIKATTYARHQLPKGLIPGA
jgi:uncharacterized LabA/DUF88 family protein